jgi:hypothetical protein
MTNQPVTTASMVDQIARAIAMADGAMFEDDPGRFRRLALAALKPLTRPTEAMVDAAHQAVWSVRFGRSTAVPISGGRCRRWSTRQWQVEQYARWSDQRRLCLAEFTAHPSGQTLRTSSLAGLSSVLGSSSTSPDYVGQSLR